ncbi:FAD linked oxidase N-terminal [Penicillium brevicompactum]|uniref:FAD linked oxidase N-terminal n=1 Tax=Penicillium brevicompactum TaxID=5074 RepID=UPI002540F625|nr:FAD linked oxidase N-terminal [Penicillium brevicompactum]KAJ5336750.1 FAD linked oxidase N-terminal [Penicillium brevicompactum]
MAPSSSLKGILLAALLATGEAAASQRCSSKSSAGAPLFDFETIQLTDQVIGKLGQNQSRLFGFGNNTTNPIPSGSCKVFPGDQQWPSHPSWSTLNNLLDGALIKTVPLAASCYSSWSQYDSEKCANLTAQWTDSNIHAADPASVMWPLFEGRSCLPTANATSSCTVGGYSTYSVNVSTVAQIQLAVNFARNSGIRLVIKNTGHDFNGKSSGAGALGIWTHNLKDIEYLENYHNSDYQGPAVKLGAGVQAFEVYEHAEKLGFTVVGGEGKTVGVAGGYVLGGGHSPLSSLYGLAADQVLALEVVLSDGRFVTVSKTSHPDLFWALRGGGGGTFGIVTSIISRVYPKIGVTVSTFQFSTGTNVSVDTFWAGVRSYFERFPAHADAGTYAYFWVMATGTNSFTFLMNPFFAVNHTLAEYNTLVEPWYNELDSLGIKVQPNSTYYDNFYDAWMSGFPLETVASSTMMTGSRLFPRSNWEDSKSLNNTFNTLRETVTAGFPLLAFNMKAELQRGFAANSANSAFRQTLMHAITSTSWTETTSNTDIKVKMDHFTNDILGKWRAVSPDAGAYMSESDIQEPHFQQSFYGSNYKRLYQLKKRYDPSTLFYTPTGVGSEEWTVKSLDGLPDQNGRLCRR